MSFFKNIFKKNPSRFKKTAWDNLIVDNPFSKSNRSSTNSYSNSIPKSVLQIIGINVAVFLFLWICEFILPMSWYEMSIKMLAVPTDTEIFYKPWTILTSAFTHLSFGHILGNMLAIFFIAPYFKMAFTDKQIWNLYFLGHLVGIFFSIGINITMLNGHGLALGASCGVSALVAGVCFKFPNMPVNILFINTTLKWLIAIYVIQSIFMLFSPNIVGGIGHLFGMVLGVVYVYLLTKNIEIGKIFNSITKLKRFRRPKTGKGIKYVSLYSEDSENSIKNIINKNFKK